MAPQWSQIYFCIWSKSCPSPQHTEWPLRWFPWDNVAKIQLPTPPYQAHTSTYKIAYILDLVLYCGM